MIEDGNSYFASAAAVEVIAVVRMKIRLAATRTVPECVFQLNRETESKALDDSKGIDAVLETSASWFSSSCELVSQRM